MTGARQRRRSHPVHAGTGPAYLPLPVNNHGNTLHGGMAGFGTHVWAGTEVHGAGGSGLPEPPADVAAGH
jgi:hypothetical protein